MKTMFCTKYFMFYIKYLPLKAKRHGATEDPFLFQMAVSGIHGAVRWLILGADWTDGLLAY